MKPYYDLNFPVSKFILDEVKVNYPTDFGKFADGSPRKWGLVYFPEEQVITQEFIDFLHSIGMRNGDSDFKLGEHNNAPSVVGTNTKQVAVFKGKPETSLFIHQDSPSTPTNSWGINFSWGAANNEVRWYAVNDGEKSNELRSVTNRVVDTYTTDQLVLIGSKVMTLKPTLIRVDIPHHGVNLDTTYQWTASIRDSKEWTWEQAVEFFKPWIDKC